MLEDEGINTLPMTVKQFEDLEIWKLARELAIEIHEIHLNSEGISKDYSLRNQMSKAVGSIMDNIAEGFERNGRNEFINFLTIAKGSAGEIMSQLYRVVDRSYISKETFDHLYNKTSIIAKKIGSLINYLKASPLKGAKFKDRHPGKTQDVSS